MAGVWNLKKCKIFCSYYSYLCLVIVLLSCFSLCPGKCDDKTFILQMGWIEAVRSLFLEIVFELYCLYCICVSSGPRKALSALSIFTSLVGIDLFVLPLSAGNAWVECLWQVNNALLNYKSISYREWHQHFLLETKTVFFMQIDD